MDEKIKLLLIDKPLVIPRILFNNYNKLNITDGELIILIFIIDKGLELEYDPSIFVSELNIDKFKVLEIIDSLHKKNIISLVMEKKNNKTIEYISLKPLYDKLVFILLDKKEDTKKEADKNIYAIFESELGRTLSPLEYEKINEWNNDMDSELIIEALKEAVFCGVNNFRYIETILSDWNKKGYKNKSDVIHDKENRKNKKKDINVPDIDWLNDE